MLRMKKSRFIEKEVTAKRTSRLSWVFSFDELLATRLLDLKMALMSSDEKNTISANGTISLLTKSM